MGCWMDMSSWHMNIAKGNFTGNLPSGQDAQLIQRAQQIGGIPIDTKRAGPAQLILAIPPTEQTDREHPRPSRGQQVPGGIADHITLASLNAEPGLAFQKQIRFGL